MAPAEGRDSPLNVLPTAAGTRAPVAPATRRDHRLYPALIALAIAIAVAAAGLYWYSGRSTESPDSPGSTPAPTPNAAGPTPGATTPPLPSATAIEPPTDAPGAYKSVNPPVESKPAVARPVAPTPAATAPRQDAATPSPLRSAVTRNPSANRPANAPAAAGSSEPCSDVMITLGLCKRNPTDKDK